MEVGHEIHQAVVDCPHPAAQGAGELPGGLPHGGGGLRVDEIRHRLRLGQIQLAVEEGPPGELPRPGLPHPLGKQGLQPQLEHRRRAVALKLRRVLPGVAAGRPGDGGQGLVNGGTVGAQQGAVDQPAALILRQGLSAGGAEHGGGGLDGAVSAQAQDADGTGEGGRGNGGDGLGHILTSTRHGRRPAQAGRRKKIGESAGQISLDFAYVNRNLHICGRTRWKSDVDNPVDNVERALYTGVLPNPDRDFTLHIPLYIVCQRTSVRLGAGLISSPSRGSNWTPSGRGVPTARV